MKLFVVSIIIFLSLPSTHATLKEKIILGLGRNCDSNSQLVVTGFNISPYPPLLGKSYSGILTGVFEKNQTLTQMVIKTTLDGNKFATNNLPLNQNYIYGLIYNFNFSLVAGTFTGLYDVQVFLENNAGNYISCWDFTYHL